MYAYIYIFMFTASDAHIFPLCTTPSYLIIHVQHPEHRRMITIKILVFSAIDFEGKIENQDFNQYFFHAKSWYDIDWNFDWKYWLEIDWKYWLALDRLLIGSWFALDLLFM